MAAPPDTETTSDRLSSSSDEEQLDSNGGDHKLSKRSKTSIQTALNLFSEYTRSLNSSLADIEQLSVSDLNHILSQYFTEMRKKDGSLYSWNSMLAIRYGLQQHFKEVRGFDIVGDKEFKSFGTKFSAVLVRVKSEGKATHHKRPLSAQDFVKLYSSSVLDTGTPDGLQNKVFVDIMVHLCKKAPESLRVMKPSDFTVHTDTSGRRYVRMRHFEGRMYENPANALCPVMAFEKYVSLLYKGCTAFWQKPNPKFYLYQTLWYCNTPVGHNTLTNKMKALSTAAGLTTVYTNHCLRATCISTLDLCGLETCQIVSDSGRESESVSRNCSGEESKLLHHRNTVRSLLQQRILCHVTGKLLAADRNDSVKAEPVDQYNNSRMDSSDLLNSVSCCYVIYFFHCLPVTTSHT